MRGHIILNWKHVERNAKTESLAQRYFIQLFYSCKTAAISATLQIVLCIGYINIEILHAIEIYINIYIDF